MVCDSFDVPAHLNEGSFHGGNAIQYFMLKLSKIEKK